MIAPKRKKDKKLQKILKDDDVISKVVAARNFKGFKTTMTGITNNLSVTSKSL